MQTIAPRNYPFPYMSPFRSRLGRLTVAAGLVVVLLLAVGCAPAPIRSAAAAKGRADLSSGTDFDRGELARLDGQWELYRDRLLGPEDFLRAGSSAPGLAVVPGIWAANSGFYDSPTPPTGVGTLRLRLRVPPRSANGHFACPTPTARRASSSTGGCSPR